MARGTALERAFELARSGECRSVSEILRKLSKEDRPEVEAHLSEPDARRQMILLCSDAWLSTN